MKRRFFSGRMGVLTAMAALAAAGWAVAAQIEAFRGHKNGAVEGFTETNVALFKAKPLEARFYNEVWFHELQFKNEGIIVTVNVQLHNLGLSRGNGIIAITVSDAGSGLLVDQFECGPDQVKIDPQGFGISIGPNRLELKGNVYQVRFQGSKIRANFTYKITVPSFQQGDGMMRFVGSEDFVRYNLPIPSAEAEGTLSYNGKNLKLKGVASMNHDWQVLSLLRYMSNWRAMWLHPDANGTIDITRCTSADLNGVWSQRLLVAVNGKNLFSSHQYTFQDLDPKPVPGAPLPCPSRFRLEAVAGDNWLKGELKVVRIQESVDVLANYPYLFRELAKAIVKQTWAFRGFCDFRFELRLNGQTQILQGRGTFNYVQSMKE